MEQILDKQLKPVHFKKKEIIFKINQKPDFVFILTKGAVREFVVDKNQNEITTWFGFENDFVVPLAGFASQSNSHSGIQAIEDCQGFTISRSQIYELYDISKEFERLGRVLAENYFISTESYHQDLLHLSANERFQKLVNQKPWIFNRVSLNYISTYLGITNETLSRLRSKKN